MAERDGRGDDGEPSIEKSWGAHEREGSAGERRRARRRERRCPGQDRDDQETAEADGGGDAAGSELHCQPSAVGVVELGAAAAFPPEQAHEESRGGSVSEPVAAGAAEYTGIGLA